MIPTRRWSARGRLRDGAELAEATGCSLVLAVDGREPSAGLLARADLRDQPGGVQIALVAASVEEPVDEVALAVAEAVAGCGRRVLVIPSGPALEADAGQPPAPSPRVVVCPGVPGQVNDFDLTIRCVPVPLWLKPGSGPVVLVATQGQTRFGEARSASRLLRRVGVEPSAAILLTRGAIDRWREGRAGSGVRPGTQPGRLGVRS